MKAKRDSGTNHENGKNGSKGVNINPISQDVLFVENGVKANKENIPDSGTKKWPSHDTPVGLGQHNLNAKVSEAQWKFGPNKPARESP